MTDTTSFHTSVSRWGNTIYYRGYTSAGKRVDLKDKNFSPVLGALLDDSPPHHFTTMHGVPLNILVLDSMKRAKEFLEGQPTNTIYGMERYEYQYINNCINSLSTEYKSAHEKYKQGIVKSWIRTLIIDIETKSEAGFPDIETASEEIILITMKQGKRTITIGSKEYETDPKYHTDDPDHSYIACSGEWELLSQFLKYYGKLDPDILTGWNINLFDLPYLYNRICKIKGEDHAKCMSPHGIVNRRSVVINGKPQTSYVFYGVNILDYYDLYRKFTYQQQSSYKLSHIASIELGEAKLSYDEYDSMHLFYKSDWNKFVEYNVKDVTLVEQFEQKLKFIDLALTVTYDAGCNPQDIFSQVRLWDCKIYNHLWCKHILIPAKKSGQKNAEKLEKYAGAYVKEPVPGLYDWIITFDVSSMYPNAIRYLNISPETVVDNPKDYGYNLASLQMNSPEDTIKSIIDGDLTACNIGSEATKYHVSISPTGDLYRNDSTGFLPDMMKELFDTRSKSKEIATEKAAYAEKIRAELIRRKITI